MGVFLLGDLYGDFGGDEVGVFASAAVAGAAVVVVSCSEGDRGTIGRADPRRDEDPRARGCGVTRLLARDDNDEFKSRVSKDVKEPCNPDPLLRATFERKHMESESSDLAIFASYEARTLASGLGRLVVIL